MEYLRSSNNFAKWFLLWSDGRYPVVLSGIKRSSFLWCSDSQSYLVFFLCSFSKLVKDRKDQFWSNYWVVLGTKQSRILCQLHAINSSIEISLNKSCAFFVRFATIKYLDFSPRIVKMDNAMQLYTLDTTGRQQISYWVTFEWKMLLNICTTKHFSTFAPLVTCINHVCQHFNIMNCTIIFWKYSFALLRLKFSLKGEPVVTMICFPNTILILSQWEAERPCYQ